MSKADAIERIVIFADGTGNAFSRQASNVWRLYDALDLTGPDQVAHYIEGVGTSGFRPFAIVDGATGIGVPSNVRKLYRFLCWNWRPGVDIYMFGFSRGAFTIRTLVGMIASQGLVPAAFRDDPVSRAEMARNAMSAWRAYRAASAPAAKVWWTISVTRAVRDMLLTIWHRLRGHRVYADVEAERERQGRGTIPITFTGLFDTVEAYGVPIAELRAPIDKAIWPISFRNRRLSPTVRRARHALSLDDERTTFHPVRFDMHGEDPELASARIREVWFAGVHSDVGGGYPDDFLAYIPLAWMAKEAEASAPHGRPPLRFRRGTPADICATASPLSAIHDSRAGLSTLYRYGPRHIDAVPASGGWPIVHHSVAEKMVFGTENYAPLMLPSQARVLMPDGSLHKIAGFAQDRDHAQKTLPPPTGPAVRDRADEAVQRLNRPNASYVDLTRDLIWMRRVAYFVLLGAVTVSVFLPVTAPWLDRRVTGASIGLAKSVDRGDWAAYWQQRLTDAKGGLGSNLADLSATFGGFVPSYAKGWVQTLVEQPFASAVILLATAGLYAFGGTLRDHIADHARCAWFIDADRQQRSVAPSPWWARLARALRTSRPLAAITRFLWSWLIPRVALVALGIVGIVIYEHALVNYRAGSGGLCTVSAPEPGLRHPKEGASNLAQTFSTSMPCWATGIVMQKGRTYQLWIAMEDAYLDGADVVGVEGFTGGGLRHALGMPLRRWWGADWFQPIARIGATGNTEWPLVSAEAVVPPSLATEASLPASDWTNLWTRPPTIDTDAVAALQEKTAARRGFVSQFTAQGTGELFIFVNDAIAAVPFGPTITAFYDNNRGTATVTVKLLASPQPPTPEGYDFSVNEKAAVP